MNSVKIIYSCRYFDLKKQSKESTARSSGTLILSILLFLLFLSCFLLMIIYYPNFETTISNFIENFFGLRTRKAISKLLLVLLFGIVFYVIKYTVGSQNTYNKTVE